MQNIISQLKELKNIKPDAGTQAAQKAMLLQQVSASARATESFGAGFVLSVREFFRHEAVMLAQPMASIAVLMLLVVGGGFFSISAASEATPGSFLYTIKLIGEKTQFALTPTQESKVKLSVSFAERRVDEMTGIVGAQNKTELKKVADNLVSEIMSVQAGLERIESQDTASAVQVARDIDMKTTALRQKLLATKQLLAHSTDDDVKTIDDAIAGVDAASLKALNTIVKAGQSGGADSAEVSRRVADKIENTKEKISAIKDNLNTVFSAGLGRAEQGIQLYNGASQKTQAASQNIAEAEKFLNDNNYSGALEKISQSEQLVQEASDTVEQKEGESAEATSSTTPEVKRAVEVSETISGTTENVKNTTTTQAINP